HCQDEIGGSDLPALGKLRYLGQVCCVAFLRAAIDPCRNRLHISIAETPAGLEIAIVGIGEPRRHFSLQYRLFDGLRPRPRVLVGQERKRTDLTRSMAVDA